jgi:hypothetical protein
MSRRAKKSIPGQAQMEGGFLLLLLLLLLEGQAVAGIR